jgi:CubicO group peptidase (beta-lactamase class C family)
MPEHKYEDMKPSILARALAASITFPLCAKAQADWQSTTPEEAGFDTAKLETLRRDLATRKTSAFLIVRRGKIAYEWYAPGNGPEKRQGTASLAKALVGGLSLLIAMNDGRIAADDPAARYIPVWKNDPVKARITIRPLATHTSGVEDAEQDSLPHDKLPGWKGAFWRRDPNPFSIAIH